ncbi:MAG TPA: TIM barrel protein [Terriglobia bacterium]|nr:TIM barrel protein [Terriglobia bacterium]
MNRRAFNRILAGAGLGSIGASSLLPASAPSPSKTAATTAAPYKISIMLWTVFRDLPFEQRLEKVSEAGYHAVELVREFEHWTDADYARVNRKKHQLSITFDTTAGLRHGVGDPEEREAFLKDLSGMLAVCEKLECPRLIVMSGNIVPGMTQADQHQSCIEGLKRAAEMVEGKNITLLVENIDPEENPRYFLTSVAEGFEIIRAVNHPQVKFLYDFYHEQIAYGNLIEKMEKNIDLVGLFHIADVPHRHQPGTGEINYTNIYKKMMELKYDGYVAMEFMPVGDPIQILRAARTEAEHIVAT